MKSCNHTLCYRKVYLLCSLSGNHADNVLGAYVVVNLHADAFHLAGNRRCDGTELYLVVIGDLSGIILELSHPGAALNLLKGLLGHISALKENSGSLQLLVGVLHVDSGCLHAVLRCVYHLGINVADRLSLCDHVAGLYIDLCDLSSGLRNNGSHL